MCSQFNPWPRTEVDTNITVSAALAALKAHLAIPQWRPFTLKIDDVEWSGRCCLSTAVGAPAGARRVRQRTV